MSNIIIQELGANEITQVEEIVQVVNITIEEGGSGGIAVIPLALPLESITRPTRSNVNIVFEGNSRTTDARYRTYPDGIPRCASTSTVTQWMKDTNVTVNGELKNSETWSTQLMQLSNFKDRFNYYNVANYGVSNLVSYGQPILTQVKYDIDVKPHRPFANGGEEGIDEAYLFIMTGILDTISATPSSIDTHIAAYKTYVDRATNDGFKVVILNEFFGFSGGFSDNAEQARLKYNRAMMDYATSGNAYMCIDVDHLITVNLDQLNLDIYHIDAYFHLTDKGNRLIAEYVNSIFTAIGSAKALAHNPYVTLSDLFKKVDKVAGKGLSTNDYTSIEKQKLASLSSDVTAAMVDSKLNKIPALYTYEVGGSTVVVAVETYEQCGLNDENQITVLFANSNYIYDVEWLTYQDAQLSADGLGGTLPTLSFMEMMVRSGAMDFSKTDNPIIWGEEADGNGNRQYFYFDDQNNFELCEGYMSANNYAYALVIVSKAYARYDYSDRVKLTDFNTAIGDIDAALTALLAIEL